MHSKNDKLVKFEEKNYEKYNVQDRRSSVAFLYRLAFPV